MKYLQNPESIWGYYFRNKTEEELISDGFIEQWNFKTETEAENALNEIANIKDYVFHKTMSYCLRKENSVYVLYTRASGFSHYLEKYYDFLDRE